MLNGPTSFDGVRVLVADDNDVSRRLLALLVTRWGFEVVEARDGLDAWTRLQEPDAPRILIIDWMMPNMDGLELTRNLRRLETRPPHFILLVTARSEKNDLLEAFAVGINDYLTKPYDQDELFARLRVGVQMVELQRTLASRIDELEAALVHIKRLQGILPICTYCKKIRDDKNSWRQLEAYVVEHTEAAFSHGICPDCYHRRFGEPLDDLE